MGKLLINLESFCVMPGGETVHINRRQNIGSGGEATIHAVLERKEVVAKLYHSATEDRSRKIAAMLAHPPDQPGAEIDHIAIAWPTAALVTCSTPAQFAGFLMPRVQGARPIFEIYNPSIRRQSALPVTYRFLYAAAGNLAAAFSALHRSGYVIGDVNESNALVDSRALVTLVDTDSFQVRSASGSETFRCPVGKPEYTPPELQGRAFIELDRTVSHDLFGLGALLFQLLMEGAHPFAAIYAGDAEPPTLEERIERGWYPYGSRPGPARPSARTLSIELLPAGLRAMFQRCFDAGHKDPSARPTAAAWQTALREAEASLIACAANARHLYGPHLPRCPWCDRREQLGGRDPFPFTPTQFTPPKKRRRRLLSKAPSAPLPVVSAPAPVPLSLRAPAPPPAYPARPLFVVAGPKNPYAWVAATFALLTVGGAAASLFGLTAVAALFTLGFGTLAEHTGRQAGNSGRILSALSMLAAVGALAAGVITAPRKSNGGTIYTGHGAVRALAFAPDGRQLAVGTSRLEDASLTDGQVRLYDVETANPIRNIAQVNGDVAAIAYDPGGTKAVVGCNAPFRSAEILLVDTDGSGAYRSVTKERASIRAVAYAPSRVQFASATSDLLIKLWDTRTLTLQRTIETTAQTEAAAYTPDGRKLAVASSAPTGSVRPGYVTLWNTQTGQRLWQHSAHGNGARAICVAPDGLTIASGGNDGAICLWDTNSGRLKQRITAHTEGIQVLAASPDGRTIADAETSNIDQSRTFQAVLRDAGTGEIRQTLPGVRDAILCAAFSPNSRVLAAGCQDGSVVLWRLPAGPR